MNLLVSGPKYDMAPGAESPTVQQQLLSLCRLIRVRISVE